MVMHALLAYWDTALSVFTQTSSLLFAARQVPDKTKRLRFLSAIHIDSGFILNLFRVSIMYACSNLAVAKCMQCTTRIEKFKLRHHHFLLKKHAYFLHFSYKL